MCITDQVADRQSPPPQDCHNATHRFPVLLLHTNAQIPTATHKSTMPHTMPHWHTQIHTQTQKSTLAHTMPRTIQNATYKSKLPRAPPCCVMCNCSPVCAQLPQCKAESVFTQFCTRKYQSVPANNATDLPWTSLHRSRMNPANTMVVLSVVNWLSSSTTVDFGL